MMMAAIIFSQMRGTARKKVGKNAEFIQGDLLEAMDAFQSDFFDCVTCGWAICYLSPQKVLKKIKRILKKNGKPMHFREIVDHINKAFALRQSAHPQTVHNELIKNDKFVLVGRGTYALTEWGYKPGRVADVIIRILREAEEPMSRDELIAAVQEERDVKLNTIVLNLQNKAYFERMKDGRYAAKS